MPQELSFKTPTRNTLWTQIIWRYSSLLPVFTDILLWKNVVGYHGYALTAVWMLPNTTVEIMVAYNPLNLDSIFTVTKITTNVLQLRKSLLPHPHFTVETADTCCIVLTIINRKACKQCWLPKDVFPWQWLFSSMPYMRIWWHHRYCH